MSIVKKGDKIKVDYEGTLEDGTVFDSTKHGDHQHPIEFVVGGGQLIKGFDEAVVGMKVGETKKIKLTPAEAYGDHNPMYMQEIPKDQVPVDEELKVGSMLMVGFPDGQKIPVRVHEVKDKTITLDFNHPMSGKTLNFDIKIVGIVK